MGRVRCDWAWRVACSTAASPPRVTQGSSDNPGDNHHTPHQTCSPCRMSVMPVLAAAKRRTRNQNGNHVEQSQHIFITQGASCYMTAGGWLANSQASRSFFRCEASHSHGRVCTDRPSVGWVQTMHGYNLGMGKTKGWVQQRDEYINMYGYNLSMSATQCSSKIALTGYDFCSDGGFWAMFVMFF